MPDPPPDEQPQPAADGTDLAKSLLSRAKAAARQPSNGGGRKPRWRSNRRDRRAPGSGWSGPDVDDRDPQTIGAVVDRLTTDNGWENEIAVHGVMARWAQIVGRDVAAKVQPVRYGDGVLTVQAESSAWATQMRMLAPQIVKRMNDEIGDGSVTRLDVQGPQSRTWHKGSRRVKGRGPRDTYG